ncbi:MAG: hypothetical protein RLZZ236_2020 [Bacteroidota bacterium]|jgi:hypothetical protein
MKNFIILITLLGYFTGYSQIYHEVNAKYVLEAHLQNVHPKGKILLNQNMIGLIFQNDFAKSKVYDSLKPYFLKPVFDSIVINCKLYSKIAVWPQNISNVIVLSLDSFNAFFDYSTERIVRKKKGKCFIQKSNEIVVKEADYSNIYITTSPPIFVNDYCLIFISAKTGNTSGSECLYLYKFDKINGWSIVKSISCKST